MACFVQIKEVLEMKLKYTAAAAFLLAVCLPCFAGPFGLQRGMTKDQVIALVGRDAVVGDKADVLGGSTLTLRRVPKPYPEFDTYAAIFSPKWGLLKIAAMTPSIRTSPDGSELNEHYTKLKRLISVSYGDPPINRDSLMPGSTWFRSEDFMMSLAKNERKLSCTWANVSDLNDKNFVTTGFLKDDLAEIELMALGTNSDSGFLILQFEFAGWLQYVDLRDKQEGSVF
jgi:hypothetical protein